MVKAETSENIFLKEGLMNICFLVFAIRFIVIFRDGKREKTQHPCSTGDASGH